MISADDIFFHLSRIDSSKGRWVIGVDCVRNTQSKDVLLVTIIVEQSINDGENFRTRELGMPANTFDILNPDSQANIINQIRNWIETSDEYGFLDLVARTELNHHGFLVLSKNAPQRIRNFTDRRIGLYRAQNMRHQVRARARDIFNLLERCLA